MIINEIKWLSLWICIHFNFLISFLDLLCPSTEPCLNNTSSSDLSKQILRLVTLLRLLDLTGSKGGLRMNPSFL